MKNLLHSLFFNRSFSVMPLDRSATKTVLICLIAFLALASSAAHSATRTATQSGAWTSTATWGGQAVPVDGDYVIIPVGKTVTYDGSAGFNFTFPTTHPYIEVAGKLVLGDGALGLLFNKNIAFDIKNGGELNNASYDYAGNGGINGTELLVAPGANVTLYIETGGKYTQNITKNPSTIFHYIADPGLLGYYAETDFDAAHRVGTTGMTGSMYISGFLDAANGNVAAVSVQTTNVTAPTGPVTGPDIASATYDASSGALAVTGTGFTALSGAANDVTVSKLTLTGEGSVTRQLTSPNVEITNATTFTVTLNAADLEAVNLIINQNGAASTGGTTYNLAAAADWMASSTGNADLTGNGITASNVAAPVIASATYDAVTGNLVVTGTGFKRKSGSANDIVVNKFSITGQGGSSYALTSATNVEVSSTTAFTITLSGTDKTQVDALLNKNGTSSAGGTTYNLAAADDWAAGADATLNIADPTLNGITVTGVITVKRYVTTTGAGTKDGSSWANASDDLQAMMTASAAGNEVWVAKGTYRPAGATRTLAAFSPINGSAVYGGFAGTETQLTDRNPVTNVTILSGDIGVSSDVSDNSYHVVKFVNLTLQTIMDGFTITGGNANGTSADAVGGGIYTSGSKNLVFNNLVIEKNTAASVGNSAGGGIYMGPAGTGNLASLTKVLIKENTATGGGAGFNVTGGNIVITGNDLIFDSNISRDASGTTGSGGAFQLNTATITATFINSLFVNNQANGTADDGGGAVCNYDGTINLINCTLYNNTTASTARPNANAIYNSTSTSITNLTNTIVWSPATKQVVKTAGTVSYTNSLVKGEGLTSPNLDTDPLFKSTSSLKGTDGIYGTADDGLNLRYSSPAKNAGTASGAPSTDLAGTLRPQGAQVDIGAFETTAPRPVISTSGTLTALSTVAGTASSSTSFTLTGTGMDAGILVTPPSGFEVSLDNTTFTSTVTAGSQDNISSTVYVRLAASAAAGTYTGNIALTSLGATAANIATASSQVKSMDATLSNLVLGGGAALSPTFSPATLSYSSSVGVTTSSITITPTVNESNATVKVNGSAATSGNAFGPVALNIGSNTLTVLVTAADGTTTKTYTVTINRTLHTAIALNGSQYATAPTSLGNFGTNDFTLEAWVKTSSSKKNVVFAKRSICGISSFFQVSVLSSGYTEFELNDGTGANYFSMAGSVSKVNDGRWHHLAAVRRGTFMALYVDGVLENAKLSNSTVDMTSTNPFLIGRVSCATGDDFAGAIDEARVYNTALTQAQIAADMVSTTAAVPASLQAYYDFNEGSGTSLTDRSGNSNGATFSGAPSWTESYALTVPVMQAASNITGTSIDFSWTPPAFGTLNDYRLQVSTNTDFALANQVSGSPFTVSGTSRTVTGLNTATTKYYARVAADKTSVTSHGAWSGIVSAPTTVPIVETQNSASITATSAVLAGTVRHTGNSAITEKGIVYGTSLDPTLTDSKVTDATNADYMSPAASSLTPNTLYHYRAYATNGAGTSYGSDQTFTTNPTPPTIQASEVRSIGVNASQESFSWTNGNGARRVVLVTASTSGTPLLVDGTTLTAGTYSTGTQVANSTGGATWRCVYNNTGSSTGPITAFTTNTTYRVMVLEYNGTGSSSSFITSTATNNPVSFNVTAATNNIFLSGASANSLSFDWAPKTGATSYTWEISTVSNFASNVTTGPSASTRGVITGLNPSTTYYVRSRSVFSATDTGAPSSSIVVQTLSGNNIRASYNFSSQTSGFVGTTDQSPVPVPDASAIAFGPFSYSGPGTTSSGAFFFSFSNWSTGSSLNTSEYFSVTVTPQTGYRLAVTSLNFDILRDANGPRNYAVRSSLDNYAANLPASVSPSNANLSVSGNAFSVSLTTQQSGSFITPGSSFTGLTAPVTFRIYPYNPVTTTGLFYVDNVTFNGATTPNIAPTDIALSASSVNENAAANTTVGTLSATDTEGGTMSYALVTGNGTDDADNAAFTISGNEVKINAIPDFETKSSYKIRIKVTDNGAATYEKAFTITVNDQNDAPTLSGGPYSFTATTINTSSAAVTVSDLLAGLTYADQDAGASKGIAVTGVSQAGNWQYSLDGTTWDAINIVGTPISATNALKLSAATQIRYTPGSSTETATMTFRAWDQTQFIPASAAGDRKFADASTSGGASSFSTGTATASILVNKGSQTITFTAPTGITYGNADFDPGATAGSGLTVTYESGNTAIATIVSGKIHIVKAGSVDITAKQAGNGSYSAATDVTRTLSIAKKDITVTLNSTPAITKIYNASDAATLAAGNYTLNTLVGTDAVTVSGTATYNDKTAAASKTITANTFVLAGADKDNYNLTTTSATTSGAITTRDLTLTLNSTPAITKVYDAAKTATLAAGNYSLSGKQGSDEITVSGTAEYDTKLFGSGKTITANTFVLAGADKANYNLTTTSATTTGAITARDLTLTLNSTPAITKIYDASKTATLAVANYSLSGKQGSDEVTVSGTAEYDTKLFGSGKTVTANTFVLAGADKANYNLTTTSATTTGAITARDLTLTLNSTPAITKVYDAAKTATLVAANYTLAGKQGSDEVSVTGTAEYDTKLFGIGKTVTANTFVLAGADKANYNLTTTSATTTGSITARNLTLTLNSTPSITKIYDAAKTATLVAANYTLVGKQGSDEVTVSGTAEYDTKLFGSGKTVTANTFVLAGADKANYNLTTTSATATGAITARELTLTLNSTPAITKIYDAGNSATLAAGNYTLTGKQGSDVVTVSGTATYDNKTVGTGKTVTGNAFVLAGADKDNYTLSTTSATATGAITARDLTLTLNSTPAITKIYDAGTSATLAAGNYTLTGKQGSDVVTVSGTATYNTKLVGTGKTITANTFVLAGADKDNYTLSTTSATTTGTITARDLTLALNSSPAISKIYDAGNSATLAAGNYTLTGKQGSDAVTVSGNATYNDKTVGTGKTITANTFVLAGADKDNYSLTTTSATTTGAITVRPLTLSLNAAPAVSKPYDGNTSATLAAGNYSLSGVQGSDALTVTGTATYDNKNAGTGKTVTAGMFVVSGADKDNYSLSTATASTTGAIVVKTITVTAEAKTKVYGDADPAFTYTASPALISGDAFSGALSRTTGENAGTYTIGKNTLALSSNYTLSYIGADLTIGKKALVITAADKLKVQGAALPALMANYSGFTSGESSSVLTAQPVLSTTATVTSPQGTYPITVSGAAAANYSISYVPGTLTVSAGAPTSLAITTSQLPENQSAGTLAGTFSSVSDDPGATFTYSLVAGTGDSGNSAFIIQGNTLRSIAAFDFETRSSYPVRVRTTNQYGLFLENTFTINVTDVNEAPTLDAIASQTICWTGGKQPIELTGISAGPETSQAVTLSISSSNSALFSSLTTGTVFGNKTGVLFELATGASGTATITVIAKDNGGTSNGGNDSFSRSFTITVNPLPVISIASTRTDTLSLGDEVTLTATAPGAATFSWSGPGKIVSGQNANALVVRPDFKGTFVYTVTAVNANGCQETASYTINVKQDFANVTSEGANNIMSPNADGSNDTWVVKNIELYPNNEVKVYDRGGRLVFSKKGYTNTWDATINGSPLAEDTYYYIVDFGPGQKKLKGFITIVRH